MGLTGRIRFRQGIFGAQILQVEWEELYSASSFNMDDAVSRMHWIDATADHVYQLNLPREVEVRG